MAECSDALPNPCQCGGNINNFLSCDHSENQIPRDLCSAEVISVVANVVVLTFACRVPAMVSSPYYHCLTLSLLLVPPLIFGTYLLVAFPSPPETLSLHPSLASLPRHAKSWQIYPEDFYEGGSYVSFPQGRMRYWLLGPENGKKVRLHITN